MPIQGFDLVKDIIVDLMHAGFLGVYKNMLIGYTIIYDLSIDKSYKM